MYIMTLVVHFTILTVLIATLPVTAVTVIYASASTVLWGPGWRGELACDVMSLLKLQLLTRTVESCNKCRSVDISVLPRLTPQDTETSLMRCG